MERQWYYAIGGRDRQGPIVEEALRDLIRQGRISGSDLLWSEGMQDWTPLHQLPGFATADGSPPPAPAAPRVVLSDPVPGFGGWLTFVGIFNILGGALTVMSCIGLPIGILMVLAGVAALGARSALQQVAVVDPALQPVVEKLRTYFVMTGWIYILHVVLFLLVLLLSAGVIVALLSAMGTAMKP